MILDILNFVFSSFWTFLGTWILLAIPFKALMVVARGWPPPETKTDVNTGP